MPSDKRWRYLKPGEILFQEGDVADMAYVIEAGELEIFRAQGEQRTVLARLGAGEVVGEMAVVDRKPRTATVAAVNAARLLVVSREHLHNKLAGADPLVRLLLQVILQRYRSVVHGAAVDVGPSADDHRAAIASIELSHELDAALARKEFFLHYQPLVHLETLAVEGFEALIRWNSPHRGVVPPAQFIPVLEDSQLIVDVGRWILQQACADLAKLPVRPGLPPPYVSVNLSARQVTAASITDDIASAVRSSGIASPQLKLELTESAFVSNMEIAAQVIEHCRASGIAVAVDDFGTGYSSLNYLSRFAIHTVKIDRTFIAPLLESPDRIEVLRAIRDLARALKLDIVAEGVEEIEQARILRELAIDSAQGYLFARPMSLADASSLLGRKWPWQFDRRRLSRRTIDRRRPRPKPG